MKMSRSKNNRMKSRKEVEQSESVTASSFDRGGKVVDSIETANVTARHSPAVSTHYQSRLDISVQDSLNLDYHSGLCTQTQDGGVEVTWDWHSPGRKPIGTNGTNIKTHEASGGTPKRARIIHKKRISNSPLMYKPLKRKLIKKENTDDIDKFKAELIALSEKIKNAQEDEKLPANRFEDVPKDDILREIEFDDFSDDGAVCIDDEVHKSLTEDRIRENKDLDELFDNSLNDDTMIKCSQEIEERLKIAPANLKEGNDNSTLTKNGRENFLLRNKSYFLSKNMNENELNRNSGTMKQNLNDHATKRNPINAQPSTMKKHKSDSIISKTLLQGSEHSTSIKTSKTASNIVPNNSQQQLTSKPKNGKINLILEDRGDLNIPDDSFDEFLATCEEDFSHSDINFTSTSANHYGKIYDSKHSELPKKSTSSPPRAPNRLPSSTPVKIKSNVAIGYTVKTNVIPNRNVCNPTEQSLLGTMSSASTKRDFKFFKSKSHSDSSFMSDNSKVTNSNTKSSNQNGFTREVSGSSVSTVHQISPICRTTSCLDSNAMKGKSIQKVNTYNTQMCHVNRCVVKEDGDSTSNNTSNSGTVASGIQSLQLCGPEEIAKKRMEAKIKLEAKKKRDKMRSNSSVNSRSVPGTIRNKR